MSAPRQPITASIVVVNRKKSPQEILFYNLLYHRVRSMLPDAKIEDLKKIVTGQITAWKRLNKKSYTNLLEIVQGLTPEQVAGELRVNAEFGAMFDGAASQIAAMTNDVLNYGVAARLTHQYLLRNIRESQRAVHRLQKVVRIESNHPLRTYLDTQDAYLNSLSSTMFVVIGAINKFLTIQEGDHSYHQTSDILIRMVRHVTGRKRAVKFSDKFYNGMIAAILPDIVAGSLTNEQSEALKTAVKAVIQLVNNQNAALGAFTKLSPGSKNAVTRAGIVTKTISELTMSIVYNPNDFINFAARQYLDPLFVVADAAHGGARVVRDFFYNAARPLNAINFGFASYKTADQLIKKVYGQNLSQTEFYTLFEFHLFVVGVFGEVKPTSEQVAGLFDLYKQHNPTNEAINVAHYNYDVMVSLWERHPRDLTEYVSFYQQSAAADRDQLLVKLMLDLNGVQRLFANSGVSSELISNQLLQIAALRANVSSLIDRYIFNNQGEQAKALQDFSNHVIQPKLQLILIDLYKSILPNICRDIMDAAPNMETDDKDQYVKLSIIFNKALSGAALVSVEEMAWLSGIYAKHTDEIIKHKIEMLPAAIQIDKRQLKSEIERINHDVRQGVPQIFEQCGQLANSLPVQSFATNPNVVAQPVQLRSRQLEEVNKIKETLELVHPHFVFEALLDNLDRQIAECKLHKEDPAFAAKITYCESLKDLINEFLRTYCPGQPVDYTPLAKGIQQLISTTVATTDKFTANAVKQATPSLGFLFKLADHFSPANGVGDRNYMDLAISFILKRMDLRKVQQSYDLYQAMNNAVPMDSMVGHMQQAQLENPLGAASVVDGVVTGYVNRMADYLMSLDANERLKVIGYIPGFNVLVGILGDRVFNREVIAKKIMEVIGFREAKPAVVNQDKVNAKKYILRFHNKKARQAAVVEDPQFNYFEETLNREKIKLRTKFADADLKKMFTLLERNDDEFINHRAIFFETTLIYLSFLFTKSTRLQEKDPIAAMKLRELVLAYLTKLEGLGYLSASQVDSIQTIRKNIEDKISKDVDAKIAEIKTQLIEVNKELGKAEDDHGIVPEGSEPAPVNYLNIALHVVGGVFEIGSAAYAVSATVIALLPLIGTAATLASYATAFVGGPLAMISLRFVFYLAKGLWKDRDKLKNIWSTKEGEEPKKGMARVADIAVKVRKTAAIVAKNVGLAVLKATLIYHVVNYVSTIKALDVRNWVVFKAIKKRVQRRKVRDESIELKALARNVSGQAQKLLAAKEGSDSKDAKSQFLELQSQLSALYAKVKGALPVVQAALQPQIDALNLLQAQLSAVFRTRQMIRQAVADKQNVAPQTEPAKKVEQAVVVAAPKKPAHIDLQGFLRDVEEDKSGKKYPQVYTNELPLPPEEKPAEAVGGLLQPVQDAVVGGVANAAAFAAAKAAGVVNQGQQALVEAGQAIGGYFPLFFGQNPGNVAPQLPQVPLPTVIQPEVPSAPIQVEAMPVSDPAAQPTGSVSQIGIFAPDYVTSEQLASRPADPTAATAAKKNLNDKKAEELSWIRANK